MARVCTVRELVTLPLGTVYSHADGLTQSGLYRLGELIRGEDGEVVDFYELDLLAAPKPSNEWPKDPAAPVPFDPPGDSWCRWGIYRWDEECLVYDAGDVAELVRAATRLFGPDDLVTAADAEGPRLAEGSNSLWFQDAVYKARCPGCGSRVSWEAHFDADGTAYTGGPCCGFKFYMSPRTVEVTTDKAAQEPPGE